MARPRKKIDVAQLEELAAILCTVDEMAAVMGCSKRTLETRFCAAIKRGRERGNVSIRRQQYKILMAGNATMAIWFGKQYLGQRDQQTVHLPELDAQIETLLAELAKRSQEAALVNGSGLVTATPHRPNQSGLQ